MIAKNLLLIFALAGIIATNVNAQTPSIPNGNFESWTSVMYEIPQNYVWSSNQNMFADNLPFNVVKSTDAYHGNYAVKMTTSVANGDTMPGVFVNINPGNSGANPASWHGGFSYSQKPTGMRGYYKSSIAAPDTATVAVFFYKGGVMIGQYGYYLYDTHSTYTLFSFDFNPALPQNPDTIIFAASSSNFNVQSNMRNGSMLLLDSVSFTGAGSQPALFNGDFEAWQSTTINIPVNWFLQGGGDNSPTGGAFKTTDAKAGSNAIELITYIGEHNNNPVANGGQISTGWYPDNCNSNCYEQGGFPFSNQVDTLAFWYKYAPSGNDMGEVNIQFKKNGTGIWSTGTTLNASSNYKYIEIPFNIGQVPDTAIVSAHSSLWQDSAISYAGSTLKIDEIHFKSQPLTTGIMHDDIETYLSVFPNPASETLTVAFAPNAGQPMLLNIYNTLGKQLLAQKISGNRESTTLDISQYAEGIYFLRITSGNIYYDRKLVITR